MKNRWVLILSLLCLMTILSSPATAQWFYINVDAESGRDGTPGCLDLDSLQYPHISYYAHNSFRRDLRYAYFDGVSWVYDTVDVTGDVGKFSSLELDTVGANISYCGNGDLKFAYWDGSGWNIEVVDSGNVSNDNYTSLALDLANGLRHISYQRDNHLMHAWWDGTWHIETVDPGNWTGYDSCIDLDPTNNNYPCISYCDGFANLLYVYWDGSIWNFETVDNAPYYTSLIVDPSGVAHIAYKKVTSPVTGELKYARRNGPGNWARETVPWPSQVYGAFPSLRMDVGGNPWIVFRDDFNQDLLLTHKEDAAWEVDSVDYVTDVGEYNSLALKHGSQPCVSYHDRTEDWLKYAEAAWVDVGVEAILAPPDTIPRVPQTPEARIKNFGNFDVPVPFAVTCTIGAWGDSRLVPAPFEAGSAYVCTFSNWTPPGPGTYNMCVTTQLPDSNSANDQLCKPIFVEYHDAGVLSILSPPDTVYCHHTHVPRAVVRNFGNVGDSIEVHCRINSDLMYYSSDTVLMAPNEVDTADFAVWWVPPIPGGPYGMTVWTTVPGDANPANDTLGKPIYIDCLMHDGAVDSILTPPDSVDFGNTYPVEALVHNYAEVTEDSFWVKCEITPGYVDSFLVDSLMSDSTVIASFSSFTVSAFGPYQMCAFTLVSGDEYTPNDTLCKPVIVRYHDGGVSAILSPPNTVNVGIPYPVEVEVTNYGTMFEDSFKVKCEILPGPSYWDSTWVYSLAGGGATQCTLQAWTPSMGGSWTMRAWTEVPNDADHSNDTLRMDGLTGVEELSEAGIPQVFGLSQSRPNPTSSVTTIYYQLPRKTQVSLKVYDITGKLVRVLVDGSQGPGFYQVSWDGRDDGGAEVPSGVYFYRISAGQDDRWREAFAATRKLVIVR